MTASRLWTLPVRKTRAGRVVAGRVVFAVCFEPDDLGSTSESSWISEQREWFFASTFQNIFCCTTGQSEAVDLLYLFCSSVPLNLTRRVLISQEARGLIGQICAISRQSSNRDFQDFQAWQGLSLVPTRSP